MVSARQKVAVLSTSTCLAQSTRPTTTCWSAWRASTSAFPSVHALDQCQFELRPGEVHALCGENGAGKSTLMNVLAGVYSADAGRVLAEQGARVVSTVQADQVSIEEIIRLMVGRAILESTPELPASKLARLPRIRSVSVTNRWKPP
jgi:ABC-type sugar transport system ATPase subunit